jgi:hypothetical protein
MYLAGKAKVECTFLYAHQEEFLFYDQYKMLFPKRIHISFPNLPSSPATAV